eukprot:scaffold3753_cov98-Skeletonema_dohrnii-CCMP3373.AAC.8
MMQQRHAALTGSKIRQNPHHALRLVGMHNKALLGYTTTPPPISYTLEVPPWTIVTGPSLAHSIAAPSLS